MDRRIHFLVAGEDKARYEAQAAREGLSLGAWLREAAEERYRGSKAREPFRAPADVEDFFARWDAAQGGDRPATEPDWEEQRRLLDASRRGGMEPS